ncbi:MAG: hypothetical protein ABJK37_08755 [Paraglaciecola sp.]|uniref:hypothetical protein n=1 Tax=Paraglaciecola sp. TaxID=1920173 RepID=UPI003297BA62
MKVIVALVVVIAIGAALWFSNSDPQRPKISDEPVSVLPVITREQLLSASDLVEGVKQAMSQSDEDAMEEWLDKALAVAKEADMSNEDIDYINSDAAKDYVIFQAKRSQFNDAIEQAYYKLLDIKTIKEDFPQAKDLFANADKLMADRDKLIEQIAAEMASGSTPTDTDRQAARQQWLTRHANQSSK